MELVMRYYVKRYQEWLKRQGKTKFGVISEFGTIYDHMYHYFTTSLHLDAEVTLSIIDHYRIEELLETIGISKCQEQ